MKSGVKFGTALVLVLLGAIVVHLLLKVMILFDVGPFEAIDEAGHLQEGRPMAQGIFGIGEKQIRMYHLMLYIIAVCVVK